MITFKSIDCPNCHKKGPYMGGCDDKETDWFLACLWCSHVIKSTQQAVMEQIQLQQEVGEQGCPMCNEKRPVKAIMTSPDILPHEVINHITHIECSYCGFRAALPSGMKEEIFARYMDLVGRRLNP